MDSLITAAAHALAAGDPLAALKAVGLREDAAALALRGIAMAQLGDFARAKLLLKRAALGFGPREAVARARCIVAEAEIALVSRDLGWPSAALDDALATLDAHGDRANAAHARNLAVRRLILIGRLDEAERLLAAADAAPLPPATEAGRALAEAGLAIRRIRPRAARTALDRAEDAARRSGIPSLLAEVESAAHALDAPAARLIRRAGAVPLTLAAVEDLFASPALVVDACRHVVREGGVILPLTTRPVLFALLRALAGAWPGDVSRGDLVARAFRAREADLSHRARLRVEIGRLRDALRGMAEISATRRGFALALLNASDVVVLAPPVDEPHAALLALLGDGEAWSSSALAEALGTSARTVQRALEDLHAGGRVRHVGLGRARRWLAPPVPGFPTSLLLPGPLPND